MSEEPLLIDALEFSNWDRQLFEELREGQITCVHATCAVWENFREAVNNITIWYSWFREHADVILHAKSPKDLEEARRTNRTAVILGFQNSSPIENQLGLLAVFRDLGIRIVQLTYNNQSLLGSGCFEKNDGGVSRFGRAAIREMNRVGMLVDLSHCGERTTLDAIEVSERPVAITHANPRALFDSRRNKTDDALKQLAQSGGVLGLCLYPLFIPGGGDCTLRGFCDMVKYAVELMGIDHVGIGSDMTRKWSNQDLEWIRGGKWTDGIDDFGGSRERAVWPRWPDWFTTPTDFAKLTAGLRENGFTMDEVEKISGMNWLRLFEAVFADD